MVALSSKDIPQTISTSYGDNEQTRKDDSETARRYRLSRHVIGTDVLRLAVSAYVSAQRISGAPFQSIIFASGALGVGDSDTDAGTQEYYTVWWCIMGSRFQGV